MNEFPKKNGFHQNKTIGFYHLLKSKIDQTLRIKLLKNDMVTQTIAVKSRMFLNQIRNTL